MESRGAGRLQSRAHRRPDLRRHGGDRRQPGGERFEIEAAAAGEDRHPALRTRRYERGAGIAQEAADRIVFRGVHVPVKQVRNARHFGRTGPRRNDSQVAINLHRIGVHHNAADPLGERDREGRLAARGRPCDKHRNLVLHVVLIGLLHPILHCVPRAAHPSS
jgi:hypothetical protein